MKYKSTLHNYNSYTNMKSPFKFLDAFTKEDRDIFFGREREIEELYHRVFDSRIMLVYGESGTGKSSLIQCGLANKFRDSDWLPVMIRRGDNLPDSIAKAVKAAATTPIEYELLTTAMFKKAIRSLYIDYYKPIFFIFDQFEELFIFGSKEEKQSLVNLVHALVDSDIECRFIFIMREEYLANVTEFEKNVHGFLSNRVRIERMPNENAVMAIKGPCSVYDIDMEDGFPEKLLKKLSPDSPYVELTYLQVYLDKIYNLALKKKEEEKTILQFSADLLEKTGDVSDLLGRFLEEQISLMPDQDAALAVLKSFVSVKGTKRQLTAQEVKDNAYTLGKSIDETALVEMIQTFVHLRILRDKDQSGRYELSHDALASKIFEKISHIEKEILEIRQFIENAHHSWQKREVLLTEEDLKYIGPYRSRLYLSEELSLFIEKSEKALEGKRRMRRQLAIAIPSAVIVVLSVFTIWALIEKNKSDKNYIKARANYFRITAKEEAATDPVLGLRLAEYAYSLDSTEDSKRTMYDIYRDNNFYKIIVRDGGPISSALFSPDGKTILTGSTNNTASLWDLNGNLLRKFIGHTGPNYTDAFLPREGAYERGGLGFIHFSPDGKKIITGSVNGEVFLWDLDGKIIRRLDGHKGWAINTSFSPDGSKILIGSYDHTVSLWDTAGNKIHTFQNYNSVVRASTFSPDGEKIFIGGVQNRVQFETSRLWDIKGNLIQEFIGHTSGVNNAVFSPDGKSILTGSSDLTAMLWDLEGRVKAKLLGHNGMIFGLGFSPDGNTIVTGSLDNTARLWNIDGTLIKEFKGHNGATWAASFSPDGNKVLTGSWDKTVRLWDIQNREKKLFQIPDEQWAYSRGYSVSKNLIITGGNQYIRVWDTSGNSYWNNVLPDPNVASVSISPDEKTLLTFSRDTVIKIWKSQIDNDPVVIKLPGVNSATFSPDGNIRVFLVDGKMELYDINGKLIKEFKVGTSPVFSPDGNSVLTSSSDNTATLKDLNENIISEFKGHTGSITSRAFSKDGKRIFTCSYDRTAILWDLSGNPLLVLKGHEATVDGGQFSPDGNSLLTVSSNDNTARIWNLKGFEIQRIEGNGSQIISATFSQDGKSVLIVKRNGTVSKCAIRTPLEEFQKQNEYEPLRVDQKLEYGIISYKDAVKLTDAYQLFQAATWFIKNDDILKKSSRIDNVNKSIILLEKAHSVKKDVKILLELYKAYNFKIYLSENDKEILNKRNIILAEFDSLKNISDIIEAAGYFYNTGRVSLSDSSKVENYSNCIRLMERISSTPIFESRITEVFNCYDYLASLFLKAGKYNEAIKNSKKAIELKSWEKKPYTDKVLAYIFSNELDSARRLYQKIRNVQYNLTNAGNYILEEVKKNPNLSVTEYERITGELNK